MRLPAWFTRFKKLLELPGAIGGGALLILGTIFTVKDIVILFPGWLWLTLGVALFVVSLLGMMYRFQQQLEGVPGLNP